jgi:hypothetical protein
MGNIRKLKKEIDSQVYELISDCFAHSEVHKEEDSEVVSGIISGAVSLRNELIHRINNPDREADQKTTRVYFQQIKSDLDSGLSDLFTRLSSASKKKKK